MVLSPPGGVSCRNGECKPRTAGRSSDRAILEASECKRQFKAARTLNAGSASSALTRYVMRAIQILAASALVAIATGARAQDIDWQKVDAAIGRSAAVTEDVHRYGFPRSDLHVTVDHVALKPAFALGGWVAFKPVNGQVMVMGDLVLLDNEVAPVMTKLLDG